MSDMKELFTSIPDKREANLLWDTEDDRIEMVPVYLHKPKTRNYQVKWLSIWQDHAEETGMSLLELAADKRLTATDFRVRDYMLCKVGFENFVHISQTEAAQYLGITQPKISHSIQKLINLGIILIGPSKGRFKTYQINPALAFVGRLEKGVQERKKAIQQHKTKVLSFVPRVGNGVGKN